MFGRRRRFAPPPPPSGRRGFFSSRQAVAAQPAPIPATTFEPTPNPNGSVFDDGSVRNIAPDLSIPATTPEQIIATTPEPRMKAGGKVGSASKRADGIAQRGKTKGKML